MKKNLNQIKSKITIIVNISAKKHHICEKDYFGILLHVVAKMGKYLASITDNSVSTCDETIDDKRLKTLATRAKLNDEATNSVSKNFNENKKKM